LVSGTKNHVKAKARRQNAANYLKLVICNKIGNGLLTKKYVPYLMVSSMSGVTRPMMKLHIQVAEVVILIARDLEPRLKISDGSTQPMGANE
jgi:hypothetical protein